MGYSFGGVEQSGPKKRRPRVRVFRYQQEEDPRPAWGDTSFTEMPEELKRRPPRFLRVFQGIINTLLLIILSAALILLVLAFAYELIFAPDVLVAWSQNLVNSVTSFFQQYLPAPPS